LLYIKNIIGVGGLANMRQFQYVFAGK